MDAISTEGDSRFSTPRILEDLADGRLSEEETDGVVAWLTAAGLEDVPTWVVNRAVRIAAQAGAAEPPRATIWRRLIAALVYDTRLHPRAPGARARGGAGGTEPPRLCYAAGGVEIDLEVGDSGLAGRVRLLGQVAATEPNLARAWVAVDGPSGHREVAVDELGQFALDGLATGAHRMQIGLVYEMIEIPDLSL
jgi:hypothetical protein